MWPNLIFEAPYMRCSLEKDAKLNTWNWDEHSNYLQIKADGMFANVIRNKGHKVMSRQGNVFPEGSLGLLEKELEQLPNETVAMGELTCYRNGHLLDRQTGNGILNSVLQGGELPEDVDVAFDAWDIVNYSAWHKGECKIPYNERFDTLVDAIARIRNGNNLVQLIETHEVGSVNEAKIQTGKWMKGGLEGGVLKNAWMPWKDGTSKGQIKLKAWVDVELRAKKLNAGTGKNSELFGSILFHSECGQVRVNVTGFSDEDRKEITENWDSFYKDSISTIKANAPLKPGPNNEYYSLFLPNHLEWRRDKKVADDLQKIKDLFEEIGG